MTIKFAIVSDVHAEQHYDWSSLVFERLGQRSHELEFAAFLGDWTTNPKNDHWEKYLPSLLSHVKCPVLGCIGNHDEDVEQWKTWFKLPMDYVRTFGNVRCVFFDSIRWNLDKEAWIDAALEGPEEQKFVFTHLSPRIGHWTYGLGCEETKSLCRLLEKHKVTASFTGHMHGFDVLKQNGTTFFICGGGGGGRHDDFFVIHRSNYYLLVECGDKFHVTLCQQHRTSEQLRPMEDWINSRESF